MSSLGVAAFIVVFFVCLIVLLDLLSAAWASIRNKHHKSAIGSFIENMSNEKDMWWVLLIIAVLFAYGLKVCMIDM